MKVLVLLILVTLHVAFGSDFSELQVEQDEISEEKKFANPCIGQSQDEEPKFPFCDVHLDPKQRARDLVGRLTLEEKIGWLGNGAKGVPRLNISAFQWWNEGLHGVAFSPGVRFNGKLKSATMFPQVITTGQSFNKTLFRMIGDAISTEARAFSNEGQAYMTFWTPNINIFRDPRWGRGHETPGEDVTLNSDYAEHFVQGFQRDPVRLKASACCKHFAAYSMEWQGLEARYWFDAKVTARDMEETYLPAFESCVRKGKASSMMCSYNAINGIPSCVNQELLDGTARKKWGFDGYITGDCGAVLDNLVTYHYQGHGPSKIVNDTLSATVDIACDNFLQLFGKKSVEKGDTDVKLVDRALQNLFQVLIRLGYFDPTWAQLYGNITADNVNTDKHHQLSLEAARQGLVLVKNQNNTLPLEVQNLDEIALIGPHGESTAAMEGNYFGKAAHIVSIKEGLSTLLPDASIKTFRGSRIHLPSYDFGKAVEAARTASQTILAVGIDTTVEAESLDRTEIGFPGIQSSLIRNVASAAKKAGKPPVVLVVLAGGAIDLSEALNHDHVGAILWTGYPGQFGGQAIAETLIGINNPSGKLTQTFYPTSFVKNVSMLDMNMHPDPSRGFPGRTYRFYTGPVVLPFGHGLSYTSFENHVLNQIRSENGSLTIQVESKNTGRISGSQLLLGFLEPPRHAVQTNTHGDLLRKLVQYRRTQILQPGESQITTFYLNLTQHLVIYPAANSTKPQRLHLDPTLNLHGRLDKDFQWTLHLEGFSADSTSIIHIMDQ